MNDNCLMLLKDITSPAVYSRLKHAAEVGDNYAWDKTMIDAHADMQMLKRQAILDAKALKDITDYINTQVSRRKAWERAGKPSGMNRGATMEQALVDLISGSGARQSAGRGSLDTYIMGIRGNAMADLVDVMHQLRTRKFGFRRAAEDEFGQNLVRGIFGGKSAKATKEMQALIESWHTVSRKLMNRFNRAGGDITELEDWGLPVNHSSSKISKVEEDEWVEDAKRLFDLRRKEIEGEELTDDQLLRKIYKTLATEGTSDFITPDDIKMSDGIKLGNRHKQWRTLQPKSGDAWLEYSARYGKHSRVIDSMVEYIDNMSTEIGLMETFGSNPQRVFDSILKSIRKTTGKSNAGSMAQAALDQITPRVPNNDAPIGQILAGLRNFQTASKLGFAPITAMTDATFSAITSVYNGMNPLNTFSRHMRLLNPGNLEDRKLAGRLGLLMDYTLNRATALNRYNDSVGYGWTHRMADFSTRASGLNMWTESGKTAFGLEFLANMGEMAAKGELPEGGLAKAFKRYGITKDDWGIMSKAVREHEGVNYLDVTQISDEHVRLKSRIIGMVREETAYAIPEPNAKARATTQFFTGRNTAANEWLKTGTQFKSFGVSIMMTHMGRVLNDTSPFSSRAAYAASAFLGTSTVGMLVLQAKDIAKGRTPRTPESSEEWMKFVIEGMAQGGGAGILGDIFFTDPDLFGGLPAYVVGPTLSDVSKLHTYLFSSEGKGVADKFARDWYGEMAGIGIKTLEESTAFATRLWYTKLAFERGLLVHARQATDLDYYKKENRKRKWLREERGQEFWYE